MLCRAAVVSGRRSGTACTNYNQFAVSNRGGQLVDAAPVFFAPSANRKAEAERDLPERVFLGWGNFQ